MSLSFGVKPLEVSGSWLQGPIWLHWAGGLSSLFLGPECPAHSKPSSQPWVGVHQPAPTRLHVFVSKQEDRGKMRDLFTPHFRWTTLLLWFIWLEPFLDTSIPFTCALFGVLF